MRTASRLIVAAAIAAAGLLGCKGDDAIPPPHPQGKDLVKGAVVAATEKAGGIRLYKIIHVDDLPDPAGPEYHMIAYEPKVATFEEAARLRKSGGTKVALDHILVRQVSFLPRDHRVIGVEPVSDDELRPYTTSIR